ncbi:MAG: trigger factor [Deltaproteobacteria bacterium]|nr:MAG: trigger factor [Deltaproteobacteria bacterium]
MSITSTSKEISSVQKQINVEVPASEVKKALDRAYQKVGQKVQLKGFRPEKAPRAMLEEYYRQDAESEAVGILLESSYPVALKDLDIHPIAQPKITVTSFGIDKNFTYEALVELRPVIDVKDYKGQKFEKDSVEIADKEIEDQIKNIQERMAQLAPLTEDRTTKAMDVVVMDYQGYLEDAPVASLLAKDSVAEIGKGYLFPELEEGLLNLKRGDKKTVDVQFPEGWADKAIAGKKVKIDVELKDIKEKRCLK